MYNRYFGNTGRYVRGEDVDDLRPEPPVLPFIEPPVAPTPAPAPPTIETSAWQSLSKLDFGAILDAPANLRGTLKSHLPEAIDFGDILLVLVLLYLFLEGEEDEMLLVLGILIVSWVLPLFRREDS